MLNITPGKKKICIGSLRHTIKVLDRSLKALNGADINIKTSTALTLRAAIETKSGVEVFDGVNVLGVATHYFYTRFSAAVTIEMSVLFNGQLFRILQVENIDSEGRFLRLYCALRGQDSLGSSVR